MRLRSLTLILAALLLALPIFAQAPQSGGVSLGELARRNRAAKAKAPEADKVITNEDIPARSGDSSGAGAAGAANGALAGPAVPAAQSDKDKAEDKEKEGGKDAAKGDKEKTRQEAYEKAKKELEQLKQRESDLNRGITNLESNREGSEAHQRLVDETVAEQRKALQQTEQQRSDKEKEMQALQPKEGDSPK